MRTPDFPGDHTASDYTVTATYDQNGITHTLPVTAVAEGSSSFIVQIGGGTSIDAEGYDEVTVHVTRDTEAGSCVSLLQIDGGGITAKGIDGIVHVADASPATVATFTDGDPGAATGDFTAQVTWVQINAADPENSTTVTTEGTVVEDGNGGFEVQATPPAAFLTTQAPFEATVEISGLGSSDSAITQLDSSAVDDIQSLTVADSAYLQNSVAATDDSTYDLYVKENDYTTSASVTLTLAGQPGVSLDRYQYQLDPHQYSSNSSGHFGNGTVTIPINLDGNSPRDFTIKVGLNNNDGEGLNGPGDQIVRTVAVHIVQLGDLTVEDDANPDNQVTSRSQIETSKHLYLTTDINSTATILLAQDVVPAFGDAAFHTLYQVTAIDGSAPTQSGTFGDESVVNLNPAASLNYVAKSGFDSNGDGILQPLEVE